MASDRDVSGETGLLNDVTDEKQRMQRFLRWFDQSSRANSDHRAATIESREFVSGKQWLEADRDRLTKAQRPWLTINKILPRVLFLNGLQRSQREEPKLLPFEGGDARHAELMGALYKWAATQAREAVVDSKVFDDKIVSGLGFWKIGWQFDEDLEGDLTIERADPLAVFPDPNWLDAGWDACEYVIQATMMALPDAYEMWPEHKPELRRVFGEWITETTSGAQAGFGSAEFAGDSMANERSFWDPETQRIRVLEVWYKKRVRVDAVLRLDTNEMSSDPEKVAMMKQAVMVQPELMRAFQFVKLPVTRVCLAHVTDQILLDDQASPYDCQILPFFPTLGYYWWRVPFGIVDPLKDLQREKNRRRSTIIEMIMRAALSGFFNPQDTGAKKEDLENYSSGVAKVIPFKSQQPIMIEPPQLPQTLVYLDSQADRDIDSVSNIHGELLGNATQRTVSGRAIQARQQSGLVVQEPLLESFRQDKEPAVRFAVELIQQFYSVPKALHILGSIAVRKPMGQEAKMLEGAGGMQEVQELLEGAFDQKYDVAIGSQPFDPSQKRQQLQTITELAQQYGPYVPPDVIIEALKDAGSLTEDQAARTLAFVEQKLAQEEAQQAARATAQHASAQPQQPPQPAAA